MTEELGDTLNWRIPANAVSLGAGEIHVWRARLDRSPGDAARLAGLLSEEERTRAARFRVPSARTRFEAGRAILREILGLYLRCQPSALRFRYREHGKPFLDLTGSPKDLRFNLSHSHGLALYAFTLRQEIGIDLEQIRPERDHAKLAQRFFAPQESAALRELAPEHRVDAFFHCWTRKEAYLKARGEGLAMPLASFVVSVAPGQPARLLSTPAEPLEVNRWSLAAIEADPGFAAALAVEGQMGDLRLWQWPDAEGGTKNF